MTHPSASAQRWLASLGLQEVVLTVFDIERVGRAMTEVGGYRMQSLPDAIAEELLGWQKTHDLSADCIAPNVGLLAMRFRVADAANYAAEIASRGAQFYAAPAKFELAPYGSLLLLSVRSPEGRNHRIHPAGLCRIRWPDSRTMLDGGLHRVALGSRLFFWRSPC